MGSLKCSVCGRQLTHGWRWDDVFCPNEDTHGRSPTSKTRRYSGSHKATGEEIQGYPPDPRRAVVERAQCTHEVLFRPARDPYHYQPDHHRCWDCGTEFPVS